MSELGEESREPTRVKFYGLHDGATHWFADDALAILKRIDDSPLTAIDDVCELHNAVLFSEAGVLGDETREMERPARSAIAAYMMAIDDASVAASISPLHHEYRGDLLDLLARFGGFERCSAAVMLPALKAVDVYPHELLQSKRLVQAYDHEVRDLLLADPRSGELIVRQYLQETTSEQLHFPASLTPADMSAMLTTYIDEPTANANYLDLIAAARPQASIGIDPKLKLRARRRHDAFVETLFEKEQGVASGAEVSIGEEQDEAVLSGLDGMVQTFSYSRAWLDESRDFATILNNFQHLFAFADDQVQLTLPSYRSQMGTIEALFGSSGRDHYVVGIAYKNRDASSLLQTQMYSMYLASHGIDLETVLQWFCTAYLPQEFDAHGFVFTPSTADATYLERCRHLFAELESLANQFRAYIDDGEIDRDLLELTSDPVSYSSLPSAAERKHLYATDHEDVRIAIHALYSDQSRLTYIDERLKADTAISLLVQHHVNYEDLRDFQRPLVDRLIELSILKRSAGDRVEIADFGQCLVLKSLSETGAASYHRLPMPAQAAADRMLELGWLVTEDRLLTRNEASYFNFLLNKVEFVNGPELRNKYLHGSQPVGDDATHYKTYLIALRTIVCLVIKINDDFDIRDSLKGEQTGDDASDSAENEA